MADNAFRYGFTWYASRGPAVPKPMKVRVASAYQAAPGAVNVDLQIGDPVKKVSDGTVALAAASDAIFGVISGVAPYYNSTLGAMVPSNRLPGGTTATVGTDRESVVWILPAADQIFIAAADDNTTATTIGAYIAFIGENCDHATAAVAPNAFPSVDISTHNTTALQWRIVDIAPVPGVDYTGLYVPLLVTCNKVQQAPFQTTGV
jgi:hypothetical protein